MYNLLAVIFSICIPLGILIKDLKKDFNGNEKFGAYIKKHKEKILICIILIIGFLTRLVGITIKPNGLNADEASIGYEAYSVLNYGIDRNGNSWPVFLEAWGSGQNALYMYIIMPFVKIMGLTVLSVRLPMAILGCFSLIVMYKLLLKTNNKKLVLIGVAFFAITPWHIMKSRYGLESNIFPDFVLYAVFFILSYLEKEKNLDFYIGAVFLGLSSYSYGISYYFLAIFVIALLVVLIKKKKITIKMAIIFLAIVLVIAFPIILMIIINSFDFNEIHIGKITIPRLTENRYEKLTLISSDNIFKTIWLNFKASMQILISQVDGYNANALEYYGIVYVCSIPLIIIGIIMSFNRKEYINLIFNIWFIVAFGLTFICEPVITRLNILYIPLAFYTVIGIYNLVSDFKWMKITIFLLYAVSFINFEITYFNTDFCETYTFYEGIENVIKYTKNIESDTIYFEYAFKEPYIYILFYNQENTEEFVNTVKYQNNTKSFDSVKEFGKYKFRLPKNINNEDNVCYVMTDTKIKDYIIDKNIWKITNIDRFCVIEKRK